MKSNNTINLTTEDILENPYNYTLKDMIQVIGEKEATAFFHKLYCEKPKKEYATIKIKDKYRGKDTTKYDLIQVTAPQNKPFPYLSPI